MGKIAIVVSARPSWAKLEPVVAELRRRGYDLDLIACAYAVTHHRSGVADIMAATGYAPTTVLHAALDANTLETSALTTGLLTIRLAGHFATTQPRVVIVNHDRHETLAASIAASYQNIPVVHLGGGETSANIDDRVRWANSMLADWHCCANTEAYGKLINAGAKIDRVFITGCPTMDTCREVQADPPVTTEELSAYGTGAILKPDAPFTIVMQHPCTETPQSAVTELEHALTLAEAQGHPLLVFWPGADSGADLSSRWLAKHAADHPRMRLVRSLPPRRFLRLLWQANYAVGNSSSLIREASYIGLPRTITGQRQRGRAYSLTPSTLYGDGYAAPRIAEVVTQAVSLASRAGLVLG